MIRGNAVEVARVFQARCKLCDWKGGTASSYEAANGERQQHLDGHRAQELDTARQAVEQGRRDGLL